MYLVVFKSKKKIPYPQEYNDYSKLLREKVKSMPGYINFENWINDEGYSVSLSRWESLDSLEGWKQDIQHQEAKSKAKWDWYSEYSIEVCEIIKSYSGKA